MLITMTFKRIITIGLSLLLSLISACGFGNTKMKAELFFEPEMQLLLKSILKNDLQTAKKLILQGISLNILGKEDVTPLLWLITQKDKKAVQLALDLGADPNLDDSDGDNAINILAGGDDLVIFDMLLKAGGNPNSIDRNGQPALFDAINSENKEMIHLLLKYGADVNLRDHSGRNSMLYPAFVMKYDLVYFFIEKGADIHVYATIGANLAWMVYDKLKKGIIVPSSNQYSWIMKRSEEHTSELQSQR